VSTFTVSSSNSQAFSLDGALRGPSGPNTVSTLTTTPLTGILKGNGSTVQVATASDIPNITEAQVTNLVSDLTTKAPLASPALTGAPTAPTAATGTNTTQVATTAFVQSEVPANVITVGRAGSGADYICTGVADDVQINAAIVQAAAGTAPATVEVIGYSYAFQYSISNPIVIKANGGMMVNLKGSNTVLKAANGLNNDMMITDNFYSEINTNYNSYSTCGNGYVQGFIFEGNSGGQTGKTLLYANIAAFPGTGVTGKMYINLAAKIGYLWNGSAYVTTGIADSGRHWRAYSYHLIKLYAFNYVFRDCQLNDAPEFTAYSEQTNTDTNVFNDYGTMEALWQRIRGVGYGLGGINWLGPHDSRWEDVKIHTNEYANNAQYNIYCSSGANWNGGGLSWEDVHPWGPTASTGNNVVLENTSVRGNAYIEGSSNQGLYATGSSVQLNLIVTNNSVNVVLNNCFNTVLRINNYYQFNVLGTMVKLLGSFNNSQVYVETVDTSNLGAGTKVFDITGLSSYSNIKLWGRIPYAATSIAAGVLATDLDDSCEIDIVKAGATGAASTYIRRIPKAGTPTTGYVLTADASGAPIWTSPTVSDKNYSQAFTSVSTVTVNHNLGKYPAVSVVDSAGDLVEGDIIYTTINQLTLSFSASFSGTVYCN
jgi:hypothetical protein